MPAASVLPSLRVPVTENAAGELTRERIVGSQPSTLYRVEASVALLAAALASGMTGSPSQTAATQTVAPPTAPVAAPCLDGAHFGVVDRCPRTLREYRRSRNWMPSELAVAELDESQADFVALGAVLERDCEWGIDWYATLPDLVRLRSVASLLDADSRRLERFSRREESTTRIVAMFSLARLLATLPRLDAQREASRLAWQAAQRAEQFLASPQSAQSAGLIRSALDGYLREQAESSPRILQTERIRWVSRPCDRIRLGEDGTGLFRAARAELASTVTTANEYPLSRLSGEPLLTEMRAAERYYEAANEAWSTPDATARLADLARRAERAEFGAWVAAARPDFVRVRGELERTNAALKELRARASPRPEPRPASAPPDARPTG